MRSSRYYATENQDSKLVRVQKSDNLGRKDPKRRGVAEPGQN
jgi:hypothetical protein